MNSDVPLNDDLDRNTTTAMDTDEVLCLDSATASTDDDLDRNITTALDTEIKIGDVFASFSEFQHKLQLYKEAHNVDFFIEDSRTLVAAAKRYPKRLESVSDPDKLKYYTIKYSCVHGGQLQKKKTPYQRNTSTLRQGCEAMMYLSLDANGKNLVVSKISEEHNHHISKELFRLLPNQRRLTPDLQQEVLELLELKANKKLVQERIQQSSGKSVTLRDLSNIAAKGKAQKQSFEETVKSLQTTYQCTVRVKVNQNNDLKALLLQDKRMQEDFEAYPEILFADSTYKLVDLRTPIFVLLVENGNGKSAVVAIGLLVSEDAGTLEWFVENFQSLNPGSHRTKVVMTDKDLVERSVIRKVMP